MIRMEHVRKSFSGNPVLRDVSLEVHDGESVVLIGRSGSGKSVTLRNILGLIQPDEGQVWVDDNEVTAMSPAEIMPLRKTIGMLFQNAALWDSMNVFDNVALALRHHKMMTEPEIVNRVYECLELVGLGEKSVAKRAPSDLSGGMRKRVGLARAIAVQPKYMLYDEPTTGLDPIMAGIIDTLIRDLNTRLHTTSLTITHDMNSAFTIADRIIMLHRGKIIYSGDVEDTKVLKDTPIGELKSEEEMVVHQLLNGDAEGLIKPGPTDHYEKAHAHQ